MWPSQNAPGTHPILPNVTRKSTTSRLCFRSWGWRETWDAWNECCAHPVVFLLFLQWQTIPMCFRWVVLESWSITWWWDGDVEGSSRHPARSASVLSYSSRLLYACGTSPPNFRAQLFTYKFWLHLFPWRFLWLLREPFCWPPFSWDHLLAFRKILSANFGLLPTRLPLFLVLVESVQVTPFKLHHDFVSLDNS